MDDDDDIVIMMMMMLLMVDDDDYDNDADAVVVFTGTVLALVGATGSTAITFVLPGFFFYYMTPNCFSDSHYSYIMRISALLFGLLGLLLMPICLIVIFI